MTYPTYRVSRVAREPLLDFIVTALHSEGCTILRASPPTEAPFRISFETPTGERLGLICYAFLANQQITRNRPTDEHRFQVKYGKKDGKLHPLWQDQYGLYTTLFVGINPDLGIFVGADPVLHSPTRFFISIEFKDEQVQQVRRTGWHAWERDRRSDEDPVEVLVGGIASSFLRYVRFERAAVGLDQGHRQLLAETLPDTQGLLGAQDPQGDAPSRAALHELANEFQLTEREILDLIGSARRLKMAVRGWVAEEHLVRSLTRLSRVTDCQRVDEEGGPDVTLRYNGSRRLTIQCKNVLRLRSADGTPRLDFQKTRASKADPCSRYYRSDEFDVVAACLHAVTERWEFSYTLPSRLTPHLTCTNRLASNVRVDPDRWTSNAAATLAGAVAQGRRG